MQYQTGDYHYVESEEIAKKIQEFNNKIIDNDIPYGLNDAEKNYVNDVMNGDYSSDYRKIQIENAIERINKHIIHFKPSEDGKVGNIDSSVENTMEMNESPSGNTDYQEWRIRQAAKSLKRPKNHRKKHV